MRKVKMILVGGFLGAGKTTLLARAAERLVRAGKRVGLITNDQAANLVDTGILRGGAFHVQEVAGGCFCCRIQSLLEASDRLIRRYRPDVLMGEPVGSCTDLSATVLNPLKDLHARRFAVGRFSVMTDPKRLAQSLAKRNATTFPDSVLYIFRKQLEEADAIVLNKADLLSPREVAMLERRVEREFPGRKVFVMSASTGAGVDEWLDYVMRESSGGERIAEVDYDTYAEGEAALGWLNASVDLCSRGGTGRPTRGPDYKAFCAKFLRTLQSALRRRSAEIAHAKVLLKAPHSLIVANLTDSAARPSVRGGEKGVRPLLPVGPKGASHKRGQTPFSRVRFLINVRAHVDPATLRKIVESALRSCCRGGIMAEVRAIDSLSPGRPTPVYRYAAVARRMTND